MTVGAAHSALRGPPRTDLRLQLRLLRAAGAWPPRRGPSTSASSLLYDGYSAGVVLLLLAFVGSQVSAMLHFWGDILSVTTNACVTFTYTMAMFKLLVVLTMRRSAEHLIDELNRCMQLMFAGVSLGFFYGYILSTTLDGFFVTLIIYLSGQLQLLNLMAENLCSAPHGSRDVGADPEESVRRRLAQCVRYHTDVDRCVQRLSTLLGPILLGQVLADVVTISATAFVTTTGKTDSGWVFKYGSYLAAIAEQLLLYCWFGNDVLTESERLQESAYSSEWVSASARFRKELRLFLCRAHRPLRLTASKFYTISRETFLLLMNASFSYYAVLRQLNSD